MQIWVARVDALRVEKAIADSEGTKGIREAFVHTRKWQSLLFEQQLGWK